MRIVILNDRIDNLSVQIKTVSVRTAEVMVSVRLIELNDDAARIPTPDAHISVTIGAILVCSVMFNDCSIDILK